MLLATLLEQRAEQMQSDWARRVAAVRGAAPSELARCLPALFSALQRVPHGDHGQPAALRDVFAQQCAQSPAQLAAAVAELALLRSCLLDLCESAGVSPAEQRTLGDFLFEAASAAVRAESMREPGALDPNEAAPSPPLRSRASTAEHSEASPAQGEHQIERERQARAAAEAERQKLFQLFMEAPAAICITEGPEHTYIFANSAYLAVVGNRELVGKGYFEALPEMAGQGYEQKLDRVYASGESELEFARPVTLMREGRLQTDWFNIAITAKRDASGKVNGVMRCVFNVTEQVQAQRRVDTVLTQLRLVMDAIPLLVSFVDVEERYVLTNKAYSEWFGRPREELTGQTVREVVGPAAYEQLRGYVRRGLSGERFTFEEFGVPYRSGGVRDIRARFIPQHDRSGAVDGYVTLIEDITARRRLEREHERFAQQRTEVLESMGDAFFALDRAWRVVLVNQNYERMCGRPREQLLGHEFEQVLPQHAAESGKHLPSYRYCMERRSAVQFVDHDAALDLWTDVRVYPNADGGIAVFLRDVSAEKRAEAALIRQSEFEQQLIGIVSHDLRNPLNVILLSSARLVRSEELSATAVKNSVRIQNAAERATRMVSDLLDFTQARLGGGIRIEPRETDLHEIVSAVIDEVEAAYPERVLRVSHEGTGQVVWDRDRMSQVVQNLVTNALKYSPEDSVVVVEARASAHEITLVIHNEGAPIPADKLTILFEPFQRAVAQVDKVSRSVGLGLYIVRQVVEAHGGTVEVESTEPAGTTFTVRLPRRPADKH